MNILALRKWALHMDSKNKMVIFLKMSNDSDYISVTVETISLYETAWVAFSGKQ
jgi:hypothetical protein